MRGRPGDPAQGCHDILSWNCIQNNQQYGFNAYSNSGKIGDLWLDHNEIVNNDTYNYEARFNGCGCSGGGKFWNVINARVTNNWVVNNKSVGLWADTDNADFEFVGNYIQNNQDVGLIYEISRNALIGLAARDVGGLQPVAGRRQRGPGTVRPGREEHAHRSELGVLLAASR
jgi:hypothetical protein